MPLMQGLGSGNGDDLLKQKGVESLPFGGKRLLKHTNAHRIDAFVHRLLIPSSSTL